MPNENVEVCEDQKKLEIIKIKSEVERIINENFTLFINNDFSLLQPEKYSYGRNSYAHVFKELKSKVDI